MNPRPLLLPAAALAALVLLPAATPAQNTVAQDTLDVVATWAPLDPANLPQSRTVVDGETLRRRGATDLRSALLLVAGVEAVPGGDGGPAASVPALWGLREFDAFLLVVDGVPWGGAFVPDLPTVDLNDVARIEVVRGPAPVTYGATSFVGVIEVVHNAPGAGQSALAAGGSHGTVRGAAAFDLSPRARLSVDGACRRFDDDLAGADHGHARLRLQLPRGIAVDADATVLQQDPASPVGRVGNVLDPAIPVDANHNPADARLDRTRLALNVRRQGDVLDWVVSASHVKDDNIRGFLDEGAADDGSTPNASGYTQSRESTELYARAFHRFDLAADLGLAVGGDALFGKGDQESRNFRYYAPLDGRRLQASTDGVPVEDTEFEAERTFLGVFAEADWHPARDWTVLAGLRLNRVDETREGEAEIGGVDTPATVKADDTRLGGRLGISWRAWQRTADELVVYANARDTFKPAAIDFGPEAEVDPLEPETARSYEVGARATVAGGRLDLDASAFHMDMENLVVATSTGGLPSLQNAGTQRFRGVELEAVGRLDAHWRTTATWAWHEAVFREFVQDFGGVPTDLSGHVLELAPRHLASLGLGWQGCGWHAEAVACYVGARWLNRRNTAEAEAYTTVDASVGRSVGRWDLWVAGRNLSDRRDPVAESELGEGQYYRLPGVAFEGGAALHF